MRFKLLPLEPFWFRITAQATPEKTRFVFVGAIFKSRTNYRKTIRDLKIAPTCLCKLQLSQFVVFQVGQTHNIQTFLMAGF